MKKGSDLKEQKVVFPIPSKDSQIGRWLWAMQDGRRRTMEELASARPEMIAWQPEAGLGSIGAILYHLAAIEADWLYVEVLETEFPEEVAALFPHPIRENSGHLTQVPYEGLEAHLRRLEAVRTRLLTAYQEIALGDFRKTRHLPGYDVTPEWVLHHLIQHEAEHRSEIGGLRFRFDAKGK